MTSWSEVRTRVLRDPELQARLRATASQAELEAAIGEPLDFDALRQAARRAYVERALPAPPEPFDDADPTGWTPVNVRFDGPEPQVEWWDLRGLDLSADPFFAQTMMRALQDPYRQLFRMRTRIDALETGRTDVAGLVMHVSRCGSTLTCRMLAADPSLVVVSEPEALDQLLRAPAPVDVRARWVRGLLAAFGGAGRRAVVKPDAWAILDMDVLKAATDAPWVFLTRDSAEVIASQLREPGSHMIPGHLPPQILGLTFEEAVTLPRADYCARVLGRVTDAARDALDERALVVDYADMPEAVIDQVAPHFALATDAEAMRAAAVADAKRPHETFDPAGSRADRPITAEVRAAAASIRRVGA